MNDLIFCKNFRFNEFCYGETVHRNNSHGVDFHYIGFKRHGKGRIITNDQVLEIDENEMFYIYSANFLFEYLFNLNSSLIYSWNK